MSRLGMGGPAFDIDLWRERMSEGSFANGVDLADRGLVTVMSVEDDLVTAHVRGGALYVVELRAPGGDGGCTCPGFEKFGACKHQVAAAVAVNAMDAADIQKVRERIARLRDGLALDSREALIERLVDLAKRQPEVLEILEG